MCQLDFIYMKLNINTKIFFLNKQAWENEEG